MKKFIAIISTIALTIIFWACSDYDITNPYHPDYGDIAPLQTLTLEPQKVDHIKVIWDSDYLNSEDGYKFQVDRKVGDDDWVEQYKLFNSDTYTFVDSSAGIDQINTYRVCVAFDEHLSTPVEATVFNEFYNPTDINLTNIDLNTVQVRWSDNSNGEDGFQIDRYSIGEWTDDFVTLDENVESWIDSTVIPNDSVQYRISAFRDGIFSAEAISPRINTQIPAPGNFKKEIINISTIKFTWIDNSTGEEGFRIEKKIALEMNWSTIDTVPEDSTTWTDLYAEVNEVLHYRVSAFKGTESSDAVELPQFENHFPPPTNLRLSQVDLNTIRLDWIDNSDGEEGFKIYKRDPLGDWWSGTPVTLGANVKTWIDTPTDIYDTLAYRVMAHKGLTTSNWSEATMSDITFPPPTDLIVTREGLSRLKFDWTDNSIGEDNFIIDKKIDTDNWIYSYGTVGAEIETWTDSLANVDHELQYRIYAKSGSNFSNYVVSDAINNTIPAPTNLQYEKLSLNSIRLSWTDNSMDEHGFIVDKFVDGAWTNEYAQVGRNSVVWTEISAEINKSIVYRMRAYYGTDFSDETDTGIINNMFPIPTNLTADVSGMNITLNWDDNSTGETGFKIDRKYNGGVWDDDYATVASDVVTWNETVVDTGKYYYRVKGFLGADESGVSEVVEGWVIQVDNPMILVPAGTFMMGSNVTSQEQPIHEVAITHSFYMAKYETTQKEWIEIMGSNPAINYEVGDNYPAYNMNWYEMLVYCNKRSISEGLDPCYVIYGATDPDIWGTVPVIPNDTWDSVECRWYENGYRLPTEAEWEFAARGGNNWTDNYLYSGSNAIDEVAWYTGNNSNMYNIVGLKLPNQLDICDMSGNAIEWCWDWYDGYYSTFCSETETNYDPIGVPSASSRVLRGGTSGSTADHCRVARRVGNPPNSQSVFGFRVARSVP